MTVTFSRHQKRTLRMKRWRQWLAKFASKRRSLAIWWLHQRAGAPCFAFDWAAHPANACFAEEMTPSSWWPPFFGSDHIAKHLGGSAPISQPPPSSIGPRSKSLSGRRFSNHLESEVDHPIKTIKTIRTCWQRKERSQCSMNHWQCTKCVTVKQGQACMLDLRVPACACLDLLTRYPFSQWQTFWCQPNQTQHAEMCFNCKTCLTRRHLLNAYVKPFENVCIDPFEKQQFEKSMQVHPTRDPTPQTLLSYISGNWA